MLSSFNVLLDGLPDSFEGYKINTDFRIGIQMLQAITDIDLSLRERFAVCVDLLFGGFGELPDFDVAQRGIEWFLNSWYTDKDPKRKRKTQEKKRDTGDEEDRKTEAPTMDWDVDQWRIYAAFLSQYRIDLSREPLHFWCFMSLLRNLSECAFTNVVDLRGKKVTGTMSSEQKNAIRKAKSIYGLTRPEDEETEYEKEQREAIIADFLSKVNIKRST